MKWQQYPSASMSAEGKSCEYINMLNFMPFLPCALSANEHKPENAVKRRTDRRMDGVTDGWPAGYSHVTSTWYRTRCGQKWKLKECIKKSLPFGYCDLDLWPWKVNPVRPLWLPMFQIWEKLIQGVLSYRINMIAVGGGRSFNMKP